jgi:hypothetical protein
MESAPHVGEKMFLAVPGDDTGDGSGHTVRSSLQNGAQRNARAARRLMTLAPHCGGEGVAVGGVGSAQKEVLAYRRRMGGEHALGQAEARFQVSFKGFASTHTWAHFSLLRGSCRGSTLYLEGTCKLQASYKQACTDTTN